MITLTVAETEKYWKILQSAASNVTLYGTTYRIRFPYIKEIEQASSIKGSVENKFSGSLLSEDSLNTILRSWGVKNDQLDSRLQDLQKQAYELLLSARVLEHEKKNADDVYTRFYKIMEEIEKIDHPRRTLEKYSSNSLTDIYESYYLMTKCITNLERGNILVWRTMKELLDDTNIGLIQSLRSSMETLHRGLPVEVIRSLARSHTVQMYWDAAKQTGSRMFQREAYDYSADQLHLISWLTYYDNVFKNIGMPDDTRMVENDKQFDEWVKNKNKELRDGAKSTESRPVHVRGKEKTKNLSLKPPRNMVVKKWDGTVYQTTR